MAGDPPRTNVRLDVARWLVERIGIALPHAQVEPGWPGDNIGRDAIWVDEIEGEQTLPVMAAGRRQRDDRFVVPFEIRSVRPALDDAADALSVLVAAVEDVLADAHTLDDDVPGVLSAEITDERSLCARTPTDGCRGFARVEVTVHTRLA